MTQVLVNLKKSKSSCQNSSSSPSSIIYNDRETFFGFCSSFQKFSSPSPLKEKQSPSASPSNKNNSSLSPSQFENKQVLKKCARVRLETALGIATTHNELCLSVLHFTRHKMAKSLLLLMLYSEPKRSKGLGWLKKERSTNGALDKSMSTENGFWN